MTVTSVNRVLEIDGFTLESGVLDHISLAYETFGTLNAEKSNAVIVEHALTGDSHVTSGRTDSRAAGAAPGWWEELVGPGRPIDTDRFFVICTNALGGCTGTTGPLSTAPDGLPYGGRFPRVSIRDMARLELLLLDHLGIDHLYAVIGGSMGGARALELALEAPERVQRLTVLAAPAYSEADQIAWAHAQVAAITMDPDYAGGDYAALGSVPEKGLGLARQIAHLTYRSDAELNSRFGRNLQHMSDDPYYAVQSYLDYHGDKLVGRFDAQAYILLTDALRDHDVRRGRADTLNEALARYTGPALVLSLSTDRLYPPKQVKLIADNLPGQVEYAEIPTDVGHDGFLTEARAVGAYVSQFLS